MISGGGNGSYLDDYPGGFVNSMLILVGLLTAFAGPAGIAALLTISILAIVVFNIFILYLQSDLKLIENGCPEILRTLLLAITIALFFLPRILKDRMVTLVMGIASTITKGAITGVVPACSKI